MTGVQIDVTPEARKAFEEGNVRLEVSRTASMEEILLEALSRATGGGFHYTHSIKRGTVVID